VSIAQFTFGFEGKVGVVVGAGLTVLPGPGLVASGSYMDKLSANCGGATVITVANSETIVAIVINVILVSLLFPIN
jgi:hypothetical protein